MNGVKHYKYFHAKKGHDIKEIYKKWEKDLEAAHKKGELKDVIDMCLKGRIRITYREARINHDGKRTNELGFQQEIILHILLNNLITEKPKQRIIIFYNFLSIWAHLNKFVFREMKNNFYLKDNKNNNPHMDRVVFLYQGHLTKMILTCFLEFLKRQQKKKNIKPDKIKLKEVVEAISNFESTTNYFWFIYNKPSKFYKYNYAINKI